MQNPLSYIIGRVHAYRLRKAEAIEAEVEKRAKNLFTLMLIEKEEQDAQAKLEQIEEQKQLAAAWHPFKTKRLTKGQAKSLTYIDDAQLQALDVIEEEIRAQLSNRAMIADGPARDKAMWAAVGVRMFMDTLKQKIDHFGGQQKREKVKKAIEAERAEKTVPRTMTDLYGEKLLTV